MQVLVTRAAEDAARTASALSALGHQALIAPVIRIVRTADDRPPGQWDALIVTSLHGAEALADWPRKEVRSFAVGPRTAEALRRQGFARIATAEGDAVSLSALILRELPGGASLLHVTGRHHKEEPARSLQAVGYPVVHWETYEAQATEALPATVAAWRPYALMGLLKAVVDGRHVEQSLQNRSTAYVSALSDALGKLSWTDIEAATGTTRDIFIEMATAIAQGRRVVVLAGQDLLRSAGGYGACLNLLDVLLLTGKLAEPGCGFAPLAEENNDQGAVEMGALAELLPGAKDVAVASERSPLARAWNAELPSADGATLNEMIEKARAGELKAMVVVGENPVGTLPFHLDVAGAFKSLELLVCQELFLTETAALAHVVLPAAAPLEKTGTWTNEEGHLQMIRPAIEPAGESRPDWEILSTLSMLLGTSFEYGESKDVLKEVRSVIPGYGLLGPAPIPPKVDPAAVERYVAGDYRQDIATRYTLAPRRPQTDGTTWHMRLTQSLFHSGKLSTRAKGLLELEEQPVLRMNRSEAERLTIADGDRVRVSNRRGELVTTVKLVERVPAGTVWFPDHFAQRASLLFDCTIDPVTKVPAFRTTSVSIVKA